jgi:ribonuclease BN (tRNA processing enzyme)
MRLTVLGGCGAWPEAGGVAMAEPPPAALPSYAPSRALDAVLALDRPGFLDAAVDVHDLEPGRTVPIGPFRVETRRLPHSAPNLGARISADGSAMMYTGDSGPSPDVVALARGVDLMLAEATEPEELPADLIGTLSTAVDAATQADRAGVGRLVLTHLWPGTDPERAVAAAASRYDGDVSVARPGLRYDW